MTKIALSLCPLVIAAASTLFAANPAGTGPEAARESVKRFKVANGLEATLFASEPMVRNPTDVDIDQRGRVWITEAVNYRYSFQKWGVLQPAGDRIVILEDTNSDGVADKETVFYQDPSINAALGICVLGNQVIVSDSPNVFVLTDTDGDGKADKRELLFTGISGRDHDHGVHAFVFGPDGKLYFNMGNEGKQLNRPVSRNIPLHGPIGPVEMKPAVDRDGNEVNNHGKPYRMGMVFRCNPDGGEIETLAWNFRNNYEVAVDSFGTLWQSDNDDDGNQGVRINYVMAYGNFGYTDEMTGAGWPTGWGKAKSKGAPESEKVFYEWHQYDPGVVPNLLHTGAGSPTGIIVYEGKLLPEIFRNQVIHCDAGPRVVRAYPAEPDGAGYKARIVDLIASTEEDKWFRPSDVCVAPDGSIYIADWNDAGVGGHFMADQKPETMTGRVYRLAPAGARPVEPKLNLTTAAGCVEALQSPNMSVRYLAWSKLHEMQGNAEKELLKVWQSGEARMRARALHLLARLKGQQYIEEALKDGDPDIRITGLRIATELKLDTIACVKSLVRDPSPQVRRECALALRHSSSPEAPKLWAQLALQHDGKDRWYLEALGIGADKQWDKFLDAWLAVVGDKWNNPAGRDVVWRSRSPKTPALLVKIINDKTVGAQDRDRFFRSLDFLSGTEKDAAMAELALGGLK
jgi:putative membrane-bound dehydrogenase-like protein